jgi:hypothetical protein
MAPSWISKKCVGRKHAMVHKLTPEENFLRVLAEFAADDPMLEGAL